MTDREKGMLFISYSRLEIDNNNQRKNLELTSDMKVRENLENIIRCNEFTQKKIAELFWEK